MSRLLQVLSVVFILGGLIGFIIEIQDISDLKRDSDFWERAYIENSDNNLIEARADAIHSKYVSKLIISITTLISGIIVGIFILAFAKVITLLEEIRNNGRIQNQSLSNAPPVIPTEI